MMKACFLAALACQLASAADCGASSCVVEEDVMSLLQHKDVVKHGSERIPNEADGWDTPVTDWNAIADSTPDTLDAGQVDEAFSSNADKTRASIESRAADNIEFANSQRSARNENFKSAADAVAADEASVKESKASLQAAVQDTKTNRKGVVDEAVARVKEAKQSALAHRIKAEQAMHAAVLGRRVGSIEGEDASHHAWADYRNEVKTERAREAREAARERIEKHEATVKENVETRTSALKAADDAWAARAHRRAEVAQARAAASAGRAQEGIEGAEGLKNRMTNIKADWAEKHYSREAESSQGTIDDAAAGNYPAGDWPVGPGDDPSGLETDLAAFP